MSLIEGTFLCNDCNTCVIDTGFELNGFIFCEDCLECYRCKDCKWFINPENYNHDVHAYMMCLACKTEELTDENINGIVPDFDYDDEIIYV
jgi:hypothetical protein